MRLHVGITFIGRRFVSCTRTSPDLSVLWFPFLCWSWKQRLNEWVGLFVCGSAWLRRWRKMKTSTDAGPQNRRQVACGLRGASQVGQPSNWRRNSHRHNVFRLSVLKVQHNTYMTLEKFRNWTFWFHFRIWPITFSTGASLYLCDTKRHWIRAYYWKTATGFTLIVATMFTQIIFRHFIHCKIHVFDSLDRTRVWSIVTIKQNCYTLACRMNSSEKISC
jgi:hypothetical protein